MASTSMNEDHFQSLAEHSPTVTIRKRNVTPGSQPRKRVKRGSFSEVHLPSSLDQNLFCRTQKPHRYCNGCSKIPLLPHFTSCDCQTVYCEACTKKVIRCTKHAGQVITTLPDKQLRIKIGKLRLKLCPNHERGCNWEGGEVYRLRSHLSECTHGKKKGRIKKDSGKSTTTNNATASTTSSESEVIIIGSDQYHQRNTEPQAIKTTPLLPIDPSCTNTPLAGYDSMPDTPSTVNQPETGQVSARRVLTTHCNNDHDTTTVSLSSDDVPLLFPPQNFDMMSVSTYIGQSTLYWTSPTFSSCEQLGYMLNLLVTGNLDDPFVLDMIVRSAGQGYNFHMKYPCSGKATLMILNPHSNSNHIKRSVRFELQFPSSEAPDFTEGNSVRFPASFVDNDCLYFQVTEVKIDNSERPWLMNPYLINEQ